MEFKRWKQYCLCSLGGTFPEEAQPVKEIFSPLILLVHREPLYSRSMFAVSSLAEALEPEGIAQLLPAVSHVSRESTPSNPDAVHAFNLLNTFLSEHGATVINTAFPKALSYFCKEKKSNGLRVTLVGLGDVGGTLLTALKLLGNELKEIAVYDPNEAQCLRYIHELNQVLPIRDAPQPEIVLASPDRLFDCDLFLFTASRGVPQVGSAVKDVRMAQFEANRKMLASYARQAKEFQGLFCQISDPVDQLSRVVFLESNRTEDGTFAPVGLLPEQIRGFGLGVMAARAAFYAQQENVDFSNGRVYGPHGKDLIVANAPTDYDHTLSQRLTELTVAANLKVRELGFKPYIAPAISSACVSILRLLRGQSHHSAVPMGGAYFGCVSRMTDQGIVVHREPLHPDLLQRIAAVHERLVSFPYD